MAGLDCNLYDIYSSRREMMDTLFSPSSLSQVARCVCTRIYHSTGKFYNPQDESLVAEIVKQINQVLLASPEFCLKFGRTSSWACEQIQALAAFHTTQTLAQRIDIQKVVDEHGPAVAMVGGGNGGPEVYSLVNGGKGVEPEYNGRVKVRAGAGRLKRWEAKQAKTGDYFTLGKGCEIVSKSSDALESPMIFVPPTFIAWQEAEVDICPEDLET